MVWHFPEVTPLSVLSWIPYMWYICTTMHLFDNTDRYDELSAEKNCLEELLTCCCLIYVLSIVITSHNHHLTNTLFYCYYNVVLWIDKVSVIVQFVCCPVKCYRNRHCKWLTCIRNTLYLTGHSDLSQIYFLTKTTSAKAVIF